MDPGFREGDDILLITRVSLLAGIVKRVAATPESVTPSEQ
jgi:hypothetical protein